MLEQQLALGKLAVHRTQLQAYKDANKFWPSTVSRREGKHYHMGERVIGEVARLHVGPQQPPHVQHAIRRDPLHIHTHKDHTNCQPKTKQGSTLEQRNMFLEFTVGLHCLLCSVNN
jgi:hypothetical protein